MRLYTFPIFFILLILSYSCKENTLESALTLAQGNRGEMEKVLSWYSEDPSDSLKYQAAVFLIENMPGHYSNSRQDEILYYHDEVLPVLNSELDIEEKQTLTDEIFNKYSHLLTSIAHDIQIIHADYLIRNIDFCFDLWKTKPWLKDISFEYFCQYILPYKCVERQYLESWRDSLSHRFNARIDTFDDNMLSDNIGKIAELINLEMKAEFPFYGGLHHNNFRIVSSLDLFKSSWGSCEDMAEMAVSVFRSHGIPCAIDVLPQWGDRDFGHSWYTVINDDGTGYPFPWSFNSEPGGRLTETPLPKVYRRTYSPDKDMEALLSLSPTPFLLPYIFYKDVTDDYRNTSTLRVKLSASTGKDRLAYLAATNGDDWKMIGMGKIKNGKATFNKVGRGVVYMVFTYDGENLLSVSDPVILENNGTTRYLVPDMSSSERVELKRKYPKSERTSNMEKRLLGGRLEASNDKNFKKFETFLEIKDLDYPDLINIHNDKAYRYWRYRGADSTWCNLAELEFYERGNNSVAKGKVIGTNDSETSSGDINNAFDGDWLTCFNYEYPSGGWVGMDFGRGVHIENVRIVPRSDDNSIHFGDMYELKYWGQDGWTTLGLQQAGDKVLYYDGVPENSLLILKNHTRGEQERIFTWENGKQRFR